MVVLGHASVEGEAGGWQGDLCRAELRRVKVSTSGAGLTNSSANVWVFVDGRSRPYQKCELWSSRRSKRPTVGQRGKRETSQGSAPPPVPIRSGCRTTAPADVSTCVAAETGREMGRNHCPELSVNCQDWQISTFVLQIRDAHEPTSPSTAFLACPLSPLACATRTVRSTQAFDGAKPGQIAARPRGRGCNCAALQIPWRCQLCWRRDPLAEAWNLLNPPPQNGRPWPGPWLSLCAISMMRELSIPMGAICASGWPF